MAAQDTGRGHGELLAFARDRLRRLDLAPPLDPDALRTALERERGTTISLVETDELPPGSAFGVTGSRADQEVVLFEARTTRSHQQLIVLHEFAHMLLGHPPSQTLHTGAQVATFHEIDAGVVAETLGVAVDDAIPPPAPRTGRRRWPRRRTPEPTVPPSLYTRVAEQEAETLATILLGWVPGQAGYVPVRPRGRLDEIFGEEGAW